MEENGRNDTVLAKIELGKENTATIGVSLKSEGENSGIDFKFKVHIPTLREDLKISVKEEEILAGSTSDEYVKIAALMLATLDVVVDEIHFTNEKNEFIQFYGSFLQLTDYMDDIRTFYKNILIPAYNEFIKFNDSSRIGFDDLKKKLTQLGRK